MFELNKHNLLNVLHKGSDGPNVIYPLWNYNSSGTNAYYYVSEEKDLVVYQNGDYLYRANFNGTKKYSSYLLTSKYADGHYLISSYDDYYVTMSEWKDGGIHTVKVKNFSNKVLYTIETVGFPNTSPIYSAFNACVFKDRLVVSYASGTSMSIHFYSLNSGELISKTDRSVLGSSNHSFTINQNGFPFVYDIIGTTSGGLNMAQQMGFIIKGDFSIEGFNQYGNRDPLYCLMKAAYYLYYNE